ncbi:MULTISPECIES: hypothetical protein [unclassified Cyanobium]|uniref:hypothetical protein n=1 Tax=unclassified Cyanobium TaxID=2627006 RepID=UPI0020CC7CE8|nr:MULTISPECIES: hypothetical protein [unclassified Cyanobium]MCP9777926.1 hypothetical protein [Cyanobium sp. Tous-M-B4]MCP9875575.1 hypothetical protein [Cyanobium sp. A2C-AMD]
MAQQNIGCATGCGTLLVLMALGVVLAYWPVFLAIDLVALLIYALALPGLQQKQRQLKALKVVTPAEAISLLKRLPAASLSSS